MNWLKDINDKSLLLAYCELFSFQVKDIHPSWIFKTSIGDYLDAYRIDTDKNKLIENTIRKELKIIGIDGNAIKKPIDPLLLLSQKTLLKLLSFIGSIHFYEEIAHKIMAKDVAKLKRDIGQDVYEFSLKFSNQYILPPLKSKEGLKELFEKDPIKALQCSGAISFFDAIEKPDDGILNIIKYRLPEYLATYMGNNRNSPACGQVRQKALKILKDNTITCYPSLV